MMISTTRSDPPYPRVDPIYRRADVRKLTRPGRRRFKRDVMRAVRHLVPNPPMRGVDWAQGNIEIPNGTRQGTVELDVVQRAVFDAMQEFGVHTVVWLKPPRAGSSTLTAIMMLFKALYDAEDVIFYERSDQEAQNFHDKKLRPIFEGSSKLAEYLRADTRSGIQDSWSDLYPTVGSAIQHRGVQTDSNFKAIRGAWVFIDEGGDKAYNASGADSEGSKVGQARTRYAEYPDGKLYLGGTPTTPFCAVVAEYEKTDQRHLVMQFPCCEGPPQPFLPKVSQAGVKSEIPGAGMKFTCDDGGDVTRIGYECAHCREWLDETKRNEVLETGRFVSKKPPKGPVRAIGFETWAAHAKDPGLSWGNIVAKYRAQLLDPAQQQDFQNLWLAQPFVPQTEGRKDPDELEQRCEEYDAECPDGVIEIFGGMDTQEGSERRGQLPRHEIVWTGIGVNEEKWVLGRTIIDRVPIEVVDQDTGEVFQDWERIDPFGPAAAQLIWQAADKGFARANGDIVYASRIGVDIGYETNKALAFCSHPESKRRKFIPLKGRKEAKSAYGKRAPAIATRPHTNERGGVNFSLLGTQGLKDMVDQCLGQEPGQPFSFHFPMSVAGTDFFKQLTCEELHHDKNHPDLSWWAKPSARIHDSNEVLDCIVLSLGAYHFQKARSVKTRKALALDPEVAKNRPRKPSVALKQLRQAPENEAETAPVAESEDTAKKREKLQRAIAALPPELRSALGNVAKAELAKLRSPAPAPSPVAASPSRAAPGPRLSASEYARQLRAGLIQKPIPAPATARTEERSEGRRPRPRRPNRLLNW